MASEVVKVIDPDNGGGTDYTSLDAWEDALGGAAGGGTPGHLVDGDEIAIAQCRASSGGDDTAVVAINGWTTDATRYIQIELHSDETNTGVWNASNYILDSDDAGSPLAIYEDFVNIRNIQVLCTNTVGTEYGIALATANAGAIINVDSCLIKGVCSGTGSTYGLYSQAANATMNIYNTIIYGFVSGEDAGHQGMRCSNGTMNVYNCTVYNCYYGIFRVGGTVTVKNVAVGNCNNDFAGTITMDYIVSDDDHSGDVVTGGKWWAPTNGAGDWTLDYETPGSDFRLKATATNLIDNGLADLFVEDDDIIGTARPQGEAWDIGAFEYISEVVNVTVTPGAITSTAAVQTPTVDPSLTVAPSVVTCAGSIQAPTVDPSKAVTPSVVTAVGSVQAPVVTTTGDALVTPSVITVVAAIQTPTVDPSKTISPSAVMVVGSVQAPTVDPSKTVAPSAITVVGSVKTPTVDPSLTVTPSVVTAIAAIQTPTVDPSLTVAPDSLNVTAAMQAPTITSDLMVTPAVITSIATVQAPTIDVGAVICIAALFMTVNRK